MLQQSRERAVAFLGICVSDSRKRILQCRTKMCFLGLTRKCGGGASAAGTRGISWNQKENTNQQPLVSGCQLTEQWVLQWDECHPPPERVRRKNRETLSDHR